MIQRFSILQSESFFTSEVILYRRLAGAAVIVPVINFWWPSFPANLSKEAYKTQLVQDQWMLRVAHYIPSLLYWWMTQKWFPSSTVAARHPEILSPHDKEIVHKFMAAVRPAQVVSLPIIHAFYYPSQESQAIHRFLVFGR